MLLRVHSEVWGQGDAFAGLEGWSSYTSHIQFILFSSSLLFVILSTFHGPREPKFGEHKSIFGINQRISKVDSVSQANQVQRLTVHRLGTVEQICLVEQMAQSPISFHPHPSELEPHGSRVKCHTGLDWKSHVGHLPVQLLMVVIMDHISVQYLALCWSC